MTYNSLLWGFEGEVFIEAADFKEEGLVTPEGGEDILKTNLSMQRI